MLILFFMISIMISLILLVLNFLIMKKINKNLNKMSPVECGFKSMKNLRLPFSIQFYYICIIFLIFDMEIVLILPMIFFLHFPSIMHWAMINFIIIIILMLGLFVEWWNNLIKWV